MNINSITSSTSSMQSTVNKSTQAVEETAMIEKSQKTQHMERTKLDDETKKELTREEAEHIVNGINEFLKPQFTSLHFKMHEELDRYYVEVIDQETKKIIREIPEKELLDMYAKMTNFLGLIIDKKL